MKRRTDKRFGVPDVERALPPVEAFDHERVVVGRLHRSGRADVDVDEVREITKRKVRDPRVERVDRKRDAVAASDLVRRSRVDRSFQMNVDLGLGHPAQLEFHVGVEPLHKHERSYPGF